jgi:hypothetical protein
VVVPLNWLFYSVRTSQGKALSSIWSEKWNMTILCLYPLTTFLVIAVPLQALSSSEGYRKLRFPDCMTTAQDGGKVVSLTHRPPLPPGNAPGTHFC